MYLMHSGDTYHRLRRYISCTQPMHSNSPWDVSLLRKHNRQIQKSISYIWLNSITDEMRIWIGCNLLQRDSSPPTSVLENLYNRRKSNLFLQANRRSFYKHLLSNNVTRPLFTQNRPRPVFGWSYPVPERSRRAWAMGKAVYHKYLEMSTNKVISKFLQNPEDTWS
jgi:hypothetical protein